MVCSMQRTAPRVWRRLPLDLPRAWEVALQKNCFSLERRSGRTQLSPGQTVGCIFNQESIRNVSEETKITCKGAPGKQFYMTTKQGKEKVRVIGVKVGNMLTIYTLTVHDEEGQVDDARGIAFLNSLFKSR